MTHKIQYKIALLFLFAGLQAGFAQKKDENIGTEVVNVVKPYTPTISDAFKVKETPTLEDEDNTKKEEIKYNIFSFPVASTFTPAKGRAAAVDKTKQEKLYKNYATLGVGNYGTLNAELFVTENLNRNEYVGGMLRHLSSQGGIDDILLDDKFYNTSLDLTYGNQQKDFSWNVDAGYQHQVYNWYGLRNDFANDLADPQDRQDLINSIDPQQTYQNIYVGGRFSAKESIFKEASLKFNHFSDAFGSSENRFYVKPTVGFEVSGRKINANFIIDYLGGSFEKDYFGLTDISYGYTNIGVQPSFVYQQDDLTVNLGAGLFYSMDSENSDNKFFVYPQITATYRIVGDVMIAYAGAEGSLKQNSYRDLVQENFFVSPTLGIAPTDQKYDVYVGLKGKIANNVGFNIRGSYKNEDQKAMFLNNPYNNENANQEGYAFGNSFNVVYDNVKTISFFGELKADFSKNVSFGVSGTFNSYTTDDQAEAWNLPELQIAANLDFNITEKWYAGTSLFFVGERKDVFSYTSLLRNELETITLDSYFDLNAHVGYKYNDRLTAFLKGNNLTSQDYQKWLNYPVQGIQVMLGASYKFDF
ncbi:outer membrane receptor protein involved in Fe transport [Flavobacterium endophyticum]|uniref:Outer membrane receptor protein involved in Fe transport n=1 Tax=Flavobacterium endophyticum TaxID=1540163 RepID=A0A495LZ13_9FLAO|nr:TonB-dependent receptor [Flavobacterium endophyticum]RKS17523.1 outer membrane receptor protein involved in Fe transport [Flavobacterium endophyticum]